MARADGWMVLPLSETVGWERETVSVFWTCWLCSVCLSSREELTHSWNSGAWEEIWMFKVLEWVTLALRIAALRVLTHFMNSEKGLHGKHAWFMQTHKQKCVSLFSCYSNMITPQKQLKGEDLLWPRIWGYIASPQGTQGERALKQVIISHCWNVQSEADSF